MFHITKFIAVDLVERRVQESELDFGSVGGYQTKWRCHKDSTSVVSLYETNQDKRPRAFMNQVPDEIVLKEPQRFYDEPAKYSRDPEPLNELAMYLEDEIFVFRTVNRPRPLEFEYDFQILENGDCLIFLMCRAERLDGLRNWMKRQDKRIERLSEKIVEFKEVEQWEIAVYRGEAKKEKNGVTFSNWREIDRIPVKARERFRGFRVQDHYYFVYDSMKANISRKPESGSRKLEPLWDDAKKPITAIIDDQDGGKIILFGKNKNAHIGAKDFYFELADKPAVKEFDVGDLKEVKAEEPIKTLWQYGTLLAERKKEKEKK